VDSPRPRPATWCCTSSPTCSLQTPDTAPPGATPRDKSACCAHRPTPDSGELADWYAIAPGIRATLQAIPAPSEDLAVYYPDRLRKFW